MTSPASPAMNPGAPSGAIPPCTGSTHSPNQTPGTPTGKKPGPSHLAAWGRRLLCIGSGAITALVFPPYDWNMLVWFVLLPLLTALWRRPVSFLQGFRMGWMYGMGWYCVSFWWIHEVGYVFGIPQPVFLGVAFIPLMCLYALLPGLWAGMAATVFRPSLTRGPEEMTSETGKSDGAGPAGHKEAWARWVRADVRSCTASALALGALWVCIEWLRAHFFCLGFSWNSLGSALYSGYIFAQWAEFVGTNGLAFIPAAFNVMLWCMLRRAYLHLKGMGRCNRPWDFYATVLVLIVLFFGGLLMSRSYSPGAMRARNQISKQNPDGAERTLMLPVMAAQINYDQEDRIASGAEPSNYGRYLRLTMDAYGDILRNTMQQAHENPDLAITPKLPVWVIWPESALPCSIWRNTVTGKLMEDAFTQHYLFGSEGLPAIRKRIREELGGQPFVLLTGADEKLLTPTDKRTPYTISLPEYGLMEARNMYNALAIIPGDLDSTVTTAKQHLMPFGEYVPLLQSIDWIGEAYTELTGTQVGNNILPGTRDEPIPVPVPGTTRTVDVIPAVCYEDTVGDLLTKFVRRGPQVIVNVSNDAWFRESACGEQQARMAAFRCIELRRSMVRAANKGVTTCIAPNGAPIHALRKADGTPWMEGYSYAELPVDLQGKITLYARWGEWFSALCAVFVLGFATLRRRSFRKAA